MYYARLVLAALTLLAAAGACKEAEMSPTPRAKGESQRTHTGNSEDQQREDGGRTDDADPQHREDPLPEGDDGGLTNATSEAPEKIEYPVLTLTGTGQTQCKESLATTTRVQTSLDDNELRIERQDVHVECYRGNGFLSDWLGIGRCDQQEFDRQVREESLGATRFVRVTKDEARQLKDQGKPLASWGIFAKSVVTHKGETYTFAQPLPVFPWPATASRYDELNAGPKTYTTTVVGARNLQVQVVVSKAGQSGDVVQLKLETTINGSGDRALYDKFPIPRTALYNVDTKNKDVRAIESLDWFDDKNCAQQGQVVMSYRLCKKVKGGKTEDLGGC